MRNLKKLFAVILTVAMIASLMVPALAATQNTEKALKLQAINVMAGTVDDLKLDEDLTRIQALTFAIRAAGKDAEALALTAEEIEEIFEGWVDVNDVADWQKPYIAYAIKEKITAGVGGGRFASMDRADGPQLLRFLLIAGMGYAPEDVTTVNAVELAIKYGILTANEATLFANDYYLIRDEAVIILYGAFMNGVNADGTNLIDAYIAKGATTASAAAAAGFISANVMTAKATAVDTIEVKFENVVNTADVSLAVTKGSNKVDAAAPVWSDGNKVATIKTTAKLTNGTYTVTATSASDEDYKLTATVEIKDQGVAEIVILNDVALTGKSSSTGKEGEVAYVYYDVLDQYGQSLRTSTSIQWSTSTNKSENRAAGVLTLSRADDKVFTYGEKIYVTGVYAKTGVSVTKELTIGMTQALNSVEFKGFVKKGTTDILKTLPAGFKDNTYYLVYKTTDQNGNSFASDNPINGNEVTFISENPLLIKEIKKDGETKLILGGDEYNAAFVSPGMSVDKGGEVNITAIANKTGNKSVLNVAVGEDQILKSFTFVSPSGLLTDGGDIEIGFNALDQNGNEITNFVTLAKQADFNKLTFTASPGYLKLSENDDGTATLKYHDVTMNWSDGQTTDGIDRIASLTSIVVGGGTDNLTITVQDKARPVAIKEVKMDNVLVEGGSTTVEFSDSNDDSSFLFIDQYGNEMDNDVAGAFFQAAKDKVLKNTDFAGYNFVIRATFKGTDGFFGFNLAEQGKGVYEIEYKGTDFEISAIGDVANAQSGFALRYEIVKYKSGEEFEKDAQSVSPVRNEDLTIVDISAVRGFNVEDVNKFYIPTEASGADNGVMFGLTNGNIKDPANVLAIPEDYQHDVSVKGTYNNVEVNIPGNYLDFSSSKLVFDGNKVISTSTDAIKWNDFYDLGKFGFPRKDSDDTVTVKVLDASGIETLDTLSKKVVLSDENPKVTTLEVKDDITLTPKNTIIEADDIKGEIELKVKDQYGVEMTNQIASYKIASIVPNADGYAENNFKVTKNDSVDAWIFGAERGDTFVVTVTVGGVKAEVKCTVGADANANITESTNNYLDKLVNDLANEPNPEGLEYQRQIGLQ